MKSYYNCVHIGVCFVVLLGIGIDRYNIYKYGTLCIQRFHCWSLTITYDDVFYQKVERNLDGKKFILAV